MGNNALLLAAKIKGQEREEFYVSLSRGFKPGSNFLARYRLNPCAALLSFIYIRMAEFNPHEFELNMNKYHVNIITRLIDIVGC